tara:strand:+ start:580 stop:1329 length:750 start_codon:yes stop_codon:yes gene_type:complete
MISKQERAELREFTKKQYDKLKEGSTTANIANYETPNAFTGDKDDDGTQAVDLEDAQYAYSIEAPKKRKNSIKLHELSYKNFKANEEVSTIQKINKNILEASKRIREVNRMLDHSVKLKTESKLTDDVHWKKTNEALVKMHKRVSALSEKANSLYNLTEATGQQAQKDLLALLQQTGNPAYDRLQPSDIDFNTVGTDVFEFDIFIDGEPLAIDWSKGNLTYMGYNEEIPLGNIEDTEDVIANIEKHIKL